MENTDQIAVSGECVNQCDNYPDCKPCGDIQKNKESQDIISKWWDVFIGEIKTETKYQLRIHHHLNIERNRLFFNFSDALTRFNIKWLAQFKENAPSKKRLLEELRNCDAYVKEHTSVRLGSGSHYSIKSAIELDINLLEVSVEEKLFEAYNFQKSKNEIKQLTARVKHDDFSYPLRLSDGSMARVYIPYYNKNDVDLEIGEFDVAMEIRSGGNRCVMSTQFDNKEDQKECFLDFEDHKTCAESYLNFIKK